MNSCQTANPKTRSAPLQKPPNLAVMAEARETKLGASIDQIPAGPPRGLGSVMDGENSQQANETLQQVCAHGQVPTG